MTPRDILRKVGPALALLLAFGALLYWQSPAANAPRVMPLTGSPNAGPNAGDAPLRAVFNRDAGKIRLLLLLDPT